ncbi:MAG: hydrogenase nickel incorporation protein HypB [Gracilibacteraceae bacterium]|jgi:hydrogenase nickel incorporation protein HypB|nr:hydrogenase nickel incorporation protein HypB [Gracilibacteraceae bacterium]
MEIEVKQSVFAENERVAAEIKRILAAAGVVALNLMGAPGAGKTSALIQIIHRLPDCGVQVIEGDIASELDTLKLRAMGVRAVQINTGGACHLEASVILRTVREMTLEPGYLFIENIGNLVCPAEFEIGEQAKILVCAATEGSDKPYKYPLAFEKAGAVLLTKCDLKEFVGFDTDFFRAGVRALNPRAPLFEVNARTGEGFGPVAAWLKELAAESTD